MMYKSTSKAIYSAKYHIVWCPQYRGGVLCDGVDRRLVGGAPLGVVCRYVGDRKAVV